MGGVTGAIVSFNWLYVWFTLFLKKKKQTLQASSLFLSPRIKACLFKIPIFRWDAEISILKYSWKGSELVLYTSEDLNRYHQHRLRS